MELKTICRSLAETINLHNDEVSCQAHVHGSWVSYTWKEYGHMIELAAAAFEKSGIGPNSRVALFSNSRIEWAVSDWAVMALKGVIVPIYHSVTQEDLQFILQDSECEVIVCETEKLMSKVLQIKKDLPRLKEFIVLNPPSQPATQSAPFITWSQFLDRGNEHRRTSGFTLKERLENTQPDDIISIVYTSGTTGQPKGVVITHEQAFSEVGEAFPLLGVNSKDQSLSFLPYAHVMGRIEHWGHGLIGFKLAFCPSIERIKTHLQEIRPTVLIAVPRIFEKIYAGVLAQVETDPIKKRLFEWAIKLGKQVTEDHIAGRSTSITTLAQYRLAKELVFKNVIKSLGGRLRFAVSGGAPLSQDLATFFHAMGILLLEGYGLTETTAAICVNTPFDYAFGTVGKPFGDVQVRIAEDGEVLVKSRKVMKGYNQSATNTDEVMKDDWFHTGDIGEFDERGFLRITDRKKDLIKTAGGKYVAPQKLENLLKTHPVISQVFVYGDQKKYVTVLLTLNHESLKAIAKNQNLSASDMARPSQSQKVRELMKTHVAQVNSKLANFETIKNFAILDREFTIESGELTPSLKLKRKTVTQSYQSVLESLY